MEKMREFPHLLKLGICGEGNKCKSPLPAGGQHSGNPVRVRVRKVPRGGGSGVVQAARLAEDEREAGITYGKVVQQEQSNKNLC